MVKPVKAFAFCAVGLAVIAFLKHTLVTLIKNMCRPYGARLLFLFLSQRLRAGLTYFAPTALVCRDPIRFCHPLREGYWA